MAYQLQIQCVAKRSLARFGLALAALMAPFSAAKAGVPEALCNVAQHPSNPDVVALRYENVFGGVLYSSDGGRTFRIRPSMTATPYGMNDSGEMLITSAGDVLLATHGGLYRSDERGCQAKTDSTVGDAAVEVIATHPREPSVVFFVSSNAPFGVREGIWKRAADGTVMAVGPDTHVDPLTTPQFYVSGMRIVEESSAVDKLRVLQTGVRYPTTPGALGTPIFRYSDDLGQTWTEQTIAGVGTPLLLAVDPTDSARVVVALSITGTPDPDDPVLVTLDNGKNFTKYLEGVTRAGVGVVAPDGRLWITDRGDPNDSRVGGGLWFATRIGEKPEKQLEDGVSCLALRSSDEKLWLCREHELGLFDPGSRAFCRVFAMADVVSLVGCSGDNLIQNAQVKSQLCGGWCKPLHYAVSPLCSIYNEERPTCGLPARRLDEETGHVPAPGAGERCVGYEALPDGALPAPVDAGDADAAASDAGARGEANDSDANDAPAERHKGGGCSLSAQQSTTPLGWLSLGALVYALRRFRARFTIRSSP